MQMDIFLWVHIVYCPWEYRIELNECIVQSGQMSVALPAANKKTGD